jgi:hypothetical protein
MIAEWTSLSIELARKSKIWSPEFAANERGVNTIYINLKPICSL